MIEIISRENQQEIQPPKNIRQVGSPGGRHKVYIEDYVYTYLKNQARKSKRSAAVLLGRSCVSKDIRYTFINGAIECRQALFQFESIYLDESFWEYLDAEQKEYFRESEITGWFVGEQGEGTNLTPVIESAHRKYFAGRDKVLMLMDTEEQEEAFYIYEQGYLQKREGYYIYYEKNLAMQEYMVEKKEEQQAEPQIPEEEELLWRSPESDREEEPKDSPEHNAYEKKCQEIQLEQKVDHASEKIFVKSSLEEPMSETEKALQNYRQMLLEKRNCQVEGHNRRFLYALSSFFIMVLCIVGITTINNYQKMKDVEEVLYVMKDSMEEKSGESDLVVESIASGVKPLAERQKQEEVGKEQKKKEKQPEDKEGSKSEQNQKEQVKEGQVGKEQQASQEQAGKEQQASQEQTGKEQQASQEKAGKEQQVPKEQAKEEKETKDSDARSGKNEEQQNSSTGNKTETQPTQTRPKERPQYYTVQAGDTLESICMKLYQNKSMIAEMCQANGIENGDLIQAGQRLLLP